MARKGRPAGGRDPATAAAELLYDAPPRAADERDPLAPLLFRPGSVFCLQSHQGDVWTWYVGVEAKEGDRIEVDGQTVQPGQLYWLLTSEAPLPDIVPDLLAAAAAGATITAATPALHQELLEALTVPANVIFEARGQRYSVTPQGHDLLRVEPPGTVRPPEVGGPPTRPPVLPLPSRISQQTFQEAKMAAIGFADGPSLRRWTPIDGEVALRHAVKDSPLETKLIATPLLTWLGLPNTVDSLRAVLRQAGVPAVLLWHVVLGAALDKMLANRAHVTVSIDQLVSAIGWDPRSRAERMEMRRRVWSWLALFDATQVIGRRDGRWRDPDTGELLDLTSRDALIRITGRRDPAQLTFDESTPPLEVSYVAGPWLEKFRGDRRVLADFGNVRKLAAIKAGKPSGAWAQAIGLAPLQLQRERASRTQPFTRRTFLDLFPPTGPHDLDRCRAFTEISPADRFPHHRGDTDGFPTDSPQGAAERAALEINLRLMLG